MGKADIISNFLGRVIDGTLKADANWRDQYGIHPIALIELVVKHPLVSLAGLLLAIAGFAVPFLQSTKDNGLPSNDSTKNLQPASKGSGLHRPLK